MLPAMSTGGPAAAVGALAAMQFLGFAVDRGPQLLVADAEVAHQVVVDHHAATARERTHREFLPLRHTELAHQEHVERRLQNDRDLPPDRHAAARQAEHQQVVLAAVGRQLLSQDLAGFSAVPEGAPRISSGEPAPSAHRSHLRYRGLFQRTTVDTQLVRNPIAATATNIYERIGPRRRTMGIEYESVVDHPLAEVFAWHTRPGAMTRLVPPWQPMTVVAETESLADGRAVLGLPGGLRWVAQHDPIGVRSAAPVRRRTVVGRACHPGPLGSSAGGGTPMSSARRPVAQGSTTTSTPRCPAAALRSTFVYRHRQLVRRSGRTPRGRRRRARSRWSSRSPAPRAWSAPRCRRS